MAEAIFDNESEWPDELGFRRGERLRVLDRRPAGGLASGWWLCADLRGNRGIAPANRLQLLAPTSLGLLHDAAHPMRLGHTLRLSRDMDPLRREPVVRSVPIRLETRTTKGSPPPPPQRRYFHNFDASTAPSSTTIPDSSAGYNGRGDNDSGLSWTPPDGPSLHSDSSNSTTYQDAYDVPSRLDSKPPSSRASDPITSSVLMNVLGNLYDSPASLIAKPLGTSSLSRQEKAPSLERASWRSDLESLPSEMERVSVGSEGEFQSLIEGGRELRLSVQEAMSALFSRQQDLESAVAALTGLAANRHWRKRRILTDSLGDVKKAVADIASSLSSFVDFASSSLFNLTQLPRTIGADLARRLAHMLRPLRDSQRLLQSQRGSVSKMGWTISALGRETVGGSDPLDQFLAVARCLPEDSRQITAFLQSNAVRIFTAPTPQAQPPPLTPSPRAPALPPPSPQGPSPSNGSSSGPQAQGTVMEEHELESSISSDRESLFDDYDFVDGPETEPPKTNGRRGEEEEAKTPTRETLGAEPKSAVPAESSLVGGESAEVVAFYGAQVEQQMEWLSRAIEEFLTAIEENASPTAYVGKSKVVILAAHKLVYVGDSLSRLLPGTGTGTAAKEASDRLCSELKDCVTATKAAAAAHPSVPAVQAMVDAMLGVSSSAHSLKVLIRDSAKPQ